MSRQAPLAALTEPARVVRTYGETAEVEDVEGITSVWLRPMLAAGDHVRPGDWVLTALGVAVAALDPDDVRVFAVQHRF